MIALIDDYRKELLEINTFAGDTGEMRSGKWGHSAFDP